jgi:hypothetical protein
MGWIQLAPEDYVLCPDIVMKLLELLSFFIMEVTSLWCYE